MWGLQERHLYSRTNFKLTRAAALAEWRQLLSALRAFGDFGRDIHFYDEGLAGIRVQMHQSVFAQLLNQIQSAANDGIFFRAGGQMFRPKTNIGIDPRGR